MLTVVSDTHGTGDSCLSGRTLTAVREADLVVHAGDFVTEAALDTFYDEADRLFAVHGNADGDAVRDRLPSARTFEYGGVRFALTHTRRGGSTGLSMFGRERGADVVIHGHSHRPDFQEGVPSLLNPGSHADPRGATPGHAELRSADGGLAGQFYTPEGDEFGAFEIAATR